MSDNTMPERLWAVRAPQVVLTSEAPRELGQEYIRADVAQAHLDAERKRIAELEAAQCANSEIVGLIAQWAFTDGSHHRQWLLDQILRAAAGNNYETVVSRLYEWDEGVPP